jgi:hypothetical protein
MHLILAIISEISINILKEANFNSLHHPCRVIDNIFKAYILSHTHFIEVSYRTAGSLKNQVKSCIDAE